MYISLFLSEFGKFEFPVVYLVTLLGLFSQVI